MLCVHDIEKNLANWLYPAALHLRVLLTFIITLIIKLFFHAIEVILILLTSYTSNFLFST